MPPRLIKPLVAALSALLLALTAGCEPKQPMKPRTQAVFTAR